MSKLVQFFFDIARALKPSTDLDPRVQYTWRQAVFYYCMTMLIVAIFSFAWAQGRVPGMSGVALADDLQSLSTSVKQDKLLAFETAIVLQRTSQCEAIAAKNALAMTFAGKIMQANLIAYRQLAGSEYPHFPTCEEVGVLMPTNTNEQQQR